VPIALYADVHIPRAIIEGLRMRHVDVRTAQEDGAAVLSDAALLDRATALGRALVTFETRLNFYPCEVRTSCSLEIMPDGLRFLP